MAVTDAYVYASSLAVAYKTKEKIMAEFIADTDTNLRRQQASKIVKDARLFCNLSCSQNFLTTSAMWLYMKLAPSDTFLKQMLEFDKSNEDYF